MRELFIKFLLELTSLNHYGKVKGKNIYFFYDENGQRQAKFEIAPKTLIFTGKKLDENHDRIIKYILDKTNNKDLSIITDTKTTLI